VTYYHPVSLTKNLLLLAGVLIGLYLTSLYSFLLFHTAAELFTITVASSVFVLTWNTRHLLDNNALLFLGTGSLFVAGITVFHTLAYKGMGVFPEYDANLPTQLWIALLYVHSLTFALAPLFIHRPIRMDFLVGSYAIVTGLLLASIFYWQIFPDCFIEGSGLTPFKIISEYVISGFFLAAIVLFIKQRRHFDPYILRLLVLSLVFNIGAEMAFTFYVSVYGFSNLTGHFLRLISFMLVYKAIVETGLIKPQQLLYRNLKQNEQALQRKTEELQHRNEELDAFSHTVAHDLKSPLTNIITATTTMVEYDTLSKEEQLKTLKIIKNAGLKMNSIITELLRLAQLRYAEVKCSPLNMVAIIEDVQQRLAYMFESHQAELILPPVWPEAVGYSPWVEEVWTNYLSNAIKYGGRPPRLELGADMLSPTVVKFWVQDNGNGLDPTQQDQLFGKFIRFQPDRVHGDGLGLSIVRNITEKMGGEVGVESTGIPGDGARFYFTLSTTDSSSRN